MSENIKQSCMNTSFSCKNYKKKKLSAIPKIFSMNIMIYLFKLISRLILYSE